MIRRFFFPPGIFHEDPNCVDFYPDTEQNPNAPRDPDLRGPAVTITTYVDADHAGNVLTHHLHTGILHFINNAPISW